MNSFPPEMDDRHQHWESVHVCPKCERVINLAELDLIAVTTGIVACPNCDWAGPIEIRVEGGKSARNE